MSVNRYLPFLLACSSIGCVAFQDCEYRAAQNCRAKYAWWTCCDERCSSNPWSDYSYGWRRGYSDVLMGGDGTCPPVPPSCYWSHKYQSECGEIAIENWFQGYRDGGAAALASCCGKYHPVPTSGESKQYCPGCLPTDRAAYPLGKTALGLIRRQRVRHVDPVEYDDAPDVPSPATTPMAPAKPDLDVIDEDMGLDHSSGTLPDETIPPAPISSRKTSETKDADLYSSTPRIANSKWQVFRR